MGLKYVVFIFAIIGLAAVAYVQAVQNPCIRRQAVLNPDPSKTYYPCDVYSKHNMDHLVYYEIIAEELQILCCVPNLASPLYIRMTETRQQNLTEL